MDPVLATPALPAAFMLLHPLLRAAPAGSTFAADVSTAIGAVVWTAPAFQRANFAAGGYPADPTLATPSLPINVGAIFNEYLYKAPPRGSAYVASVNTAAAAVVWPAPGYPHANFAAGGYP